MNATHKQMQIENEVRDNIDVEKMGLVLVGREYRTALGRVDILTKDADGNYVPIEIKVGEAGDSAIGQILGYMNAVGGTHGIIMANAFTNRVISVAKSMNIALIQYEINIVPSIVNTIGCDDTSLIEFVNECCITDYDAMGKLYELYESYLKWCIEHNIESMTIECVRAYFIDNGYNIDSRWWYGDENRYDTVNGADLKKYHV